MTKPKVEVGDEVTVRGLPGVRVVEAIADGIARLRLFGDIEDSPNKKYKPGDRVYFGGTEEVPVERLSVVGKKHKRPAIFHLL